MKRFILLCIIVFMLTGCEAAILGLHHNAAYGNLDGYCVAEYGRKSFYHSAWEGCVVPGMKEETCEANGGRLRSLMNRCIIPIR